MTDTGTYLYAVTRAPAAAPGVAGLDEGRIRLVEHRGLVALVSDVDLADYGEEGLRTNLEDLRWLEAVARGHDAVVRAAAAGGPVTPFRLATVFFDDKSMLASLDECYEALVRALERVDDRMEWSVKAVIPDASADEAPDGNDARSTSSRAGSGTAYLMQKRAAQQRRETVAEQGAALADDFHRALSTGVVASRRLSPQDPRLTGHKGTMVLNAAYLVDNAAADVFVDTVAELQRSHPTVSIDVHGPWPPYSFATLDQQ